MTPEEMERVGEILERALAVEPVQRSRFLDEACRDDVALRHEVESLLLSHEQAGSRFLDAPAAGSFIRSSISPGRKIGPYLVEVEIGHGGMGEVFAAARADGHYNKKVAIKLVRGGYDSEFVLERFRNERQILAGLDHPNIARLLDGGTTEDGVPYLVMELVDGSPIDVYCDTRKLSITDRLKLFLQVCNAVQYAHQRLVIHRDIKPSNILVTQEAVPKLLDFGIAKILDTSNGSGITALHPMTPEYASPEQVRGDTITTATDVYSLGVVLYLLLTGRSPYYADTVTPAKLAQAITHTEPERPSTSVRRKERILSDGELRDLTPEAVSSTRETSPIRLQHRLRGDLDFILLKVLRKEPDRRYSSVEQFAEDIRRHLAGLPVAARRGTWSYRTGKFIRRNRAGVAASAIVLLTLVTGVILVVHEARIAEANRRRAEARFNDVRKLANSLIFEIHDSIQDVPGTTDARKLLASRALEYLDALSHESGGDPSLQRELAAAYKRIGDVQGSPYSPNLGDAPGALQSYQKARAIRQSLYASKSRTLDDDVGLAEASRLIAETLLVSSKTSEAFKNSGYAIEIAEQAAQNHPNDPAVLRELSRDYETHTYILGGNFNSSNLGDVEDAIAFREKQIKVAEQVVRLEPNSESSRFDLVVAQIMLGDQLLMDGRIREADAIYERGAGALREMETSSQSARMISIRRGVYTRLNFVSVWAGDIRRAIAIDRSAVQLALKSLRRDPHNASARLDLAEDYANLADAVSQSQNPGEATDALNKAIELIREVVSLNPENTEYLGTEAAVYNTAGEVFRRIGDARRALELFREATSLYSKIQEEDPQNADNRLSLAASYNPIGIMQAQLGDVSGAVQMHEKALALVQSGVDSNHPSEESLYTAADAYAGLAEAESILARKSDQGSTAQKEHWKQACKWNERSLKIWSRIKEPGALSPHGFYCTPPSTVSQRRAECKSELARFDIGPDHATRSVAH